MKNMDIKKIKDIIPNNLIEFLPDVGLSDEERLKGYFNITKAKERNLLINLTNYLIQLNQTVNYIFSKAEIQEKILIKTFDREIYLEEFFIKIENDKFKINNSINLKIEVWLKNHQNNNNVIQEKEFIEIYESMNRMFLSGNINKKEYDELIASGIAIAKNLHWKYLPIYEEQTIINRQCTPEEDLLEYYNHYHTLEDLYKVIKGEKIDLNNKNGDITLNKPFKFEIYTNRWNHYDTYIFERTMYGWEIFYFDTYKCLKNGENGLFTLLNHDYVFYPKEGVAYALEKLWEKADNGELSIENLQVKLQEVAEWISDVERSLRRKQPEWCNYY